ncbi:CHAT domain-containing protein [Nocardioides sp. zg-1228]|uniref:CHAT domain-containing protein n=1 Tax=Nocardioides sp. zg-1228 TaxID=2763008 RepID=UPI0016430747|nr:CHAT domain-containing protein [Nocardioides sp. zg-1228]MBC2931567.1 CHAT domain-containing protein [Nocardioides sp. zg-1228]QSF57167.1 CHAT domain-containing protein [Nocardioides sp. zg-1228]
MTDRSVRAKQSQDEAAELLRGMFVDLAGARARAHDLVRSSSDPITLSYARQVLGIAHREQGDLPRALRELRTAMRLAEEAGSRTRRADVQATLGGTLATAGRTREGLEHLDAAIAVLRGTERATALTRRGWVYITAQGRFDEGAADMTRAVERFAAEGDQVWHARALNLLGYACLFRGALEAADRHFALAGRISTELGDDFTHAVTVQNHSYVAYLAGDLPRAFALLGEAAEAFAKTGATTADLVIDRSTAYLTAGLLPEARESVASALEEGSWPAKEQADLLSVQARVALAAGDHDRAESTASRAARILTHQGREWFAARVQLVALTARHARSRRTSPALRRDALALVERSRRLRIPEHVQVLLLAATIVGDAEPGLADELLREAERAKRHDAALTRALGWLATARRQMAAGRTAATLRACERGLSAIAEHQSLLGSDELRALASARGQELATLGLRSALAAGRPRQVLHWTERWRGTVVDAPSVVHRDVDTARDLAALRSQTQQANSARDAGQPTAHLERRIADLERRIRERHLLRSGRASGAHDPAGADGARAEVSELLDTLAEHDTTLVELFTLDGDLHAVVAHRGRARLVHVGDLAKAVQAQEYARFLLTRAGRGQSVALAQAGARLQAALLGDQAVPGSGPVLVSAPNQLQRLPWALLPALTDRAVSSTPSARLWLRASRRRPASDRRSFIVGPGLASGGAEVETLRRHDPDAAHLAGDTATVQACLAGIDGAALVHIAAHGSFRKDNPLFSSIELADGPLMVHDLERLARPPHRVVLSACETGDMQPVGADELLGLSVSLLAMGSAGVVSSLVKVHDHATAEVMTHLHAALRDGESGAAAMLLTRQAVADDQLLLATAVSFTALGT